MPRVASGCDEPDDDGDLGECPECGTEVSLIAGRCPECGYWFLDGDSAAMRGRHRTRDELKLLTVGAAVLIAILVSSAVIAIVAN
jgi:predicted ATP-dependent serine protease